MSKRILILIHTLVYLSPFAFAAMAPPQIVGEELETKSMSEAQTESLEEYSISDAPSPDPLLKEQEIPYSYERAVHFRFGAGLNPKGDDDDLESLGFMGFGYVYNSITNGIFEFQIDLLNDGTALLAASMKFVLDPDKDFRPHFKIGPSMNFEARDGLAGPLRLENYSIYIAGGIENSWSRNWAFRFDLEAHLGGYGSILILQFGSVWVF